MKIISDFKDYYDSLTTYDSDIVYNRFQTISKNIGNFPCSDDYYYDTKITLHGHAIGFCGKIYPLMKLIKGNTDYYCYSINHVDKFVSDFLSPKENKIYNIDKKDYKSYRSYYSSFIRHNLNEFFTNENWKNDYSIFFKDYPIFVYSNESRYNKVIVFNAYLNDLQFYRVVDPYQAFQELSMWIGNTAKPIKPIPKIDDVTMAEVKGFNKWSFRKESTKK